MMRTSRSFRVIVEEIVCCFSPAHVLRQNERNATRKLYQLLWLLKATRQAHTAMGIATEASFDKGRSYDFILLEGDPQDAISLPNYEEIKRQGEALFGTTTPI